MTIIWNDCALHAFEDWNDCILKWLSLACWDWNDYIFKWLSLTCWDWTDCILKTLCLTCIWKLRWLHFEVNAPSMLVKSENVENLELTKWCVLALLVHVVYFAKLALVPSDLVTMLEYPEGELLRTSVVYLGCTSIEGFAAKRVSWVGVMAQGALSQPTLSSGHVYTTCMLHLFWE